MAYLDFPTRFVDSDDDHEVFVNGADLNLLRSNAINLDGLTYRQHPFFTSQAGPDTGSVNHHSQGNTYIFRGAFQFATGMTTLTVQGYAAGYGSNPEDVQIYLYKADNQDEDGSHPSSATKVTVPVTNNWTGTVSLAPLNLVNGELYYVDVRWDPSNYFDTMDVYECYVGPVPSVGTWGGVPTFDGINFPASKFNQLVAAEQWLFNRINIMPLYPLMAQMYRQATHKQDGINIVSGGVHKHYAEDTLRLELTVTCFCPKEKVQLFLNGSVVWESSYLADGKTADIVAVVPLTSYPVGQPIKAVLYAKVDQGRDYPDDEKTLNSRYTIRIFRTEAASSYPAATPPAAFPRNLEIAASDLTARLNAIATMLQNTYNRIAADTFTWNRIRVMTRPMAQDAKQFTRIKKRYVPRFERRGARLFVRGKGIKLGYGANTLENPDEDGDDKEFKYTLAHMVDVTDGDKVQWKTVYLDTAPALYKDETYYALGEITQYVAEYLE